MQLSTNLPYGIKAIREHLDRGVELKMNVSEQADRAFMAELRRTDLHRFNALEKAIRTEVIRLQAKAQAAAVAA
jgi:hypothetical protein